MENNLTHWNKTNAPIKRWGAIREKDWIILKDGRVCQVVDRFFHNFYYRDKSGISNKVDGFLICILHPAKNSNKFEKITVRKNEMFGFVDEREINKAKEGLSNE